MTSSFRELPRIEMPRVLVYVTSVTCGLLVAMAVQILLSRRGIDLTSLWRDLLSSRVLQFRSAGAWWTIAGSAFLASAAIAAALSRLPLPWHRFRLIRWIVSAGIVFGLAEVGHLASEMPAQGGGVHLAASLTALIAAALIALFGAFFACRR